MGEPLMMRDGGAGGRARSTTTQIDTAVVATPAAERLASMLRAEPQRLRRRSISLGVPIDEADDAAQIAALRAWRAVEGMRADGGGQMCAWLDTIIRTTAIDLHRARRAELGEVMCDQLQSRQDVAGDVELRERLASAFRAIDALSDDLRRPLLMSVVDELTADQIGERLGISGAAVRQRLTRARRALRR